MVTIQTTQAPPATGTSSTWLVPALALSTFVTMVHAMALAPLLPEIAVDLGTSVSLLGQISAASMLLAGMLGVLAGPLIDRFGHRRSLGTCLGAVAFSAIGMAIAPAYLPLLLAALFGAIGRAVAQPVALVIVGDRFSGDRQRRAVSWVMAGVTGSPIVGIPALTALASDFGWRVALGCLAAATALLIPLVHRAAGREAPSASGPMSIQHFLDAYRPILRHRPTFGLIAATLLSNASTWVMATYLGVFYADRHDYTTGQIGWVFFVIGVTLFAGNLAAGGRVGTLSLRPLLILARLVVGVLIAILLMAPVSAILGLALLGGVGLTIGIGGVAGVLLLMRESPASRATTLTLNTVVLNLGIALGGMLGGLLLAVADFAALGLCSLLLGLAAALLVWGTGDRRSGFASAS